MQNILILGSSGSIGKAISKLYLKEGYAVIGLDINKFALSHKNFHHITYDLRDTNNYKELLSNIKKITNDNSIRHVINTTAIQTLNKFDKITEEELLSSLNINAISQLKIFNLLKKLLIKSKSAYLSINSIHARLSKKNFLSYSSSKKLLEGIMDALSLEFSNHKIRIIQIFPAAIKTIMLKDGLGVNGMKKISSFHPSKSIGKPEELADLVFKVLSVESSFMNGAKINFDGGISNLLHDPSSE